MSLDSLWDDFLLKLQQLLSVGSLRPHLKRRGLLTDEEYARLLSRDGEPASVQAEHLVVILRRKGSQGPHQLLQALQDSLAKPGYHRGHEELAQLFQERLDRTQQPTLPPAVPAAVDTEMVRYTQLINAVVEGLNSSPDALQHCTTSLGSREVQLPPLADLPALFGHMTHKLGCGPQNHELLRFLLNSMQRPDLLQLVDNFESHPPPASTPEQASLSAPCSEQELWLCSRELHSWETLALVLGFSSADIYALKRDYQETAEQRQQLLLCWRRRLGSEATFHVLVEAADAIGDQHFATTVRRTALRSVLEPQTLPGTTNR